MKRGTINIPQPKIFSNPTNHNWVKAPCCGESKLRMVASATNSNPPPRISSHWSRVSWMSGSLRVERRRDDLRRVLAVLDLPGLERLLVIVFHSAGALYPKLSYERQVNSFIYGAHRHGFHTLWQACFLTSQRSRYKDFAETQARRLFDARLKLPHRAHFP